MSGRRGCVRGARAGVTLIEILVAITLLSLLATGVLIAMRLGFGTMDKTNTYLSQNRRVVNARRIVESEIGGFVLTFATFYPQPLFPTNVVFFQAEPQSMRFVTTYSLNEGLRGRPQIAELQVIAGERGEGARLILNETPYTGPLQAGLRVAGVEPDPTGRAITNFQPIRAGAGSFVLADRLAYCRFSYLEVQPRAPFQLWQQAWVLKERLPLGVRIEMAPLDSARNAAGAQLHVTSVTVPLRVDRIPAPGIIYAD